MTTIFPAAGGRPAVDTNEDQHSFQEEQPLDARIAEILGDQLMPPSQKRAELEELLGTARDTGDEEAYAPVEHQLLHALSLLADGGHDYSVSSGEPDGPAEKIV